MKALGHFYLSIYFATRNDKNWSKTSRVKFLIESVLFMFSASILFLAFGIFNIRTNNIKTVAILLSVSYFTANLVKKLIVGAGKEQEYIKQGKHYNSKKKKTYGLIGLLGYLMSFVLLILSAILMSYLWSLELF